MQPALLDALRIFTGAYLVAMMFAMGLEVGGEPPAGKQAKRHERWLLVRALAFNLLLLPLVALTLTKALHTSGDIAIAFLLLAASPGGRFAPQLAKIAGASLGLSTELTLFLAKLVSFTAPPTAAWMLRQHRVELHELPLIAQMLLLQLVPYFAARRLRRRKPDLAHRLARPFAIATWAGLGAVLALAVASHRFRAIAALAGDRGWWAVLAFAVLGLALGWLLGGPAVETRRTFAISANARDLALAIMIGTLAFPARNVQIAAFGVWLLLTLTDVGFAVVARARGRRAGALPDWTHPVT
jgi:BASS family bile acid:Na+ symporter